MMPDYTKVNPFQNLLKDELVKNGISVTYPKGYKRVLPIFRESLCIKPDILHLHWMHQYLNFNNYALILIYGLKLIIDILLTKRILGIRVVWTIHNEVSHGSPFPLTEKFLRRVLFSIVDDRIVHGNTLVRIISSSYKVDHKKINSIRLGNYSSLYPDRININIARQKLNLESNCYLFLHLGQIKPYKGTLELIKQWKKLGLNDSTLAIVGECTDKKYLDELNYELIDSNRIIFINEYVSNDEISIWFSAANVSVLPFLKIMGSSSVMLSISFGIPVITNNVGFNQEILGDSYDLLYDNLEDLSSTIIKAKLIDLEKLGKESFLKSQEFNWSNIALDTLNIYKNNTISN